MPQRHWHGDWDDAGVDDPGARDPYDATDDDEDEERDDAGSRDDEDEDADDDDRGDDEESDDDLDDDPSLEDDFPLGDGTADTSASVVCPYCGEENEIAVDPGSGSAQSYVEDCGVCCRPWRVSVSFDEAGRVTAWADQAD